MLTATTSRTSRRDAFGFTLVELLVVIAIIGVLVAMLLPAVSRARGAAWRTQCINNQSQLGKGILGYANAKGRMPANSQLISVGGSIEVGWTYPILPFIEQQPVRDQIDTNGINQTTGAIGGAPAPNISVFNCPADPSEDSDGPKLSYAANSGLSDSLSGTVETRADGAFSRRATKPSGAYSHSFETDLSYISQHDGTTTTILISESTRLSLGAQPPGWTNGKDWHNGIIWDPATPNLQLNKHAGYSSSITESDGAEDRSPTSGHTGGFVVTFCGGNARFVSERIDGKVYGLLMSASGSDVSISAARAWQSQNVSEVDIDAQ